MRLVSLLLTSLPCTFVNAGPRSILFTRLLGSSKESSPNPIANTYPTLTTGTINGTIAVVPIPYKLARNLIPSQYGILTAAYESLLPGFPPDSYPLIIKAILDHDIRQYGINLVPDFQSVHIFYPFVDLLGDGYSSFAYEKSLIVTATNLIAIGGASFYGQTAVPASFDPPYEAYGFTASSQTTQPGEIFFNAFTSLFSNTPSVTTNFVPMPSVGPWPFEFYVNVTNQPSFSNGLKCDQQILLYNSTLSLGTNAPVGIQGNISVAAPYLPSDSTFTNVNGLKVDAAFIENNFLDCSSLQGYSFNGGSSG